MGASDSLNVSAKSRGLRHIILSCVFFAAMANLAYLAQILEPGMSTLSVTGPRISINFVGVLLVGLFGKFWHSREENSALTDQSLSVRWKNLVGDGRASLWGRGIFGSLAMIFYFAALKAIGAGESTFLQSSNSIFIATLAPLFLKQKNSLLGWLALAGSAVGLFLLLEPRITDANPLGRWYGLGAGFFSSMAYLMIAKAGRTNRPETVVFYFCAVGCLLHVLLITFVPVVWPHQVQTWLLLLGAGAFGTVAQFYLTSGYQLAPAALASAVSYLQPVLNTLAGVFFFSHPIDGKAWIGALLICGFGVCLPFVIRPKESRTFSK